MTKLNIAGVELGVRFKRVSADPKRLFSPNHQMFKAKVYNYYINKKVHFLTSVLRGKTRRQRT